MDSLLTQLRGGKGASIVWFPIRFRRRNHLGRITQPLRVQAVGEDTFGIPERSSDQIQGNPSEPF
jgi:hypothetical protein